MKLFSISRWPPQSTKPPAQHASEPRALCNPAWSLSCLRIQLLLKRLSLARLALRGVAYIASVSVLQVRVQPSQLDTTPGWWGSKRIDSAHAWTKVGHDVAIIDVPIESELFIKTIT